MFCFFHPLKTFSLLALCYRTSTPSELLIPLLCLIPSCSDPGFGSKSPLVLSVVTLRTWILIFVRGVGSAMPHPFPFLSKRLKIDYKAIDDRMQQLAHARSPSSYDCQVFPT